MIEKETQGKLVSRKLRLMQMSLGFSPNNVDSAKEIMKLVELLERLEHEADEDPQLSVNCGKYKPELFREVRWLLLLKALTHLRYNNAYLDSEEKCNILSILGFIGGYEQIDEYRIQCLKNDEGRALR